MQIIFSHLTDPTNTITEAEYFFRQKMIHRCQITHYIPSIWSKQIFSKLIVKYSIIYTSKWKKKSKVNVNFSQRRYRKGKAWKPKKKKNLISANKTTKPTHELHCHLLVPCIWVTRMEALLKIRKKEKKINKRGKKYVYLYCIIRPSFVVNTVNCNLLHGISPMCVHFPHFIYHIMGNKVNKTDSVCICANLVGTQQ